MIHNQYLNKSLKFFLIILISLIVLYPSFNLALTGDDYLGLWRYNFYTSGRVGKVWDPISFFLTDYGPQDTFTAIIHYFVGFNSTPYYLFSFLFRLLAAFSFIPLIYYITKNKFAAVFTGLFFSVITTGLETTNWSFNAPSYLAILFLNLFLLTSSIYREKQRVKFFGFFRIVILLNFDSPTNQNSFFTCICNTYWIIFSR